ncbi:hypothetical protein PHAVU_008G171200 [Phaseolus vulgaris]|uniref:Uncharacterized protein n=1 Tax=Phaseolus vulgaris TaxID=3885 RepID=V7B8H3_PHAVU|nr:hypothetical protein PHAVU_008G171200g [Phaseolus vulgaris]ESW13138.1 hypothetical protein PHAVU_008G171200g [Phaseolus vulgaris]
MFNGPRSNTRHKRMREIDKNVFVTKCVKFFSLWHENVKNYAWHQFKVVMVNDKLEVCTTLTCFLFIMKFCLNWLNDLVTHNFLSTH